MSDLEQALTLKIRVDGDGKITAVAQDLGKVGAAAQKASSESSGAFAGMSQAVSSFTGVIETLKATVAALGIVEVFHLASEAIKEVAGAGDRLRDMTASLQGVVGSAQGAAAALTFFEEAQKSTRATSDELVKAYSTMLPQALRAGFGKEQFRDVTVTLANFATATGKSFQEVQEAFEQLLNGVTGRGRNPILNALGLSGPEVLAGTAGAQKLIDGMNNVAGRAAAMGDSFESALTKIKSTWETALGQGFNSSTDKATAGIHSMVVELTKPEILESIAKIGKAFADMLPTVAKVVGAVAQLVSIPKAIVDRLDEAHKLSEFLQAGPASLYQGARIFKQNQELPEGVQGPTLAGADRGQFIENYTRSMFGLRDASAAAKPALDAAAESEKKTGDAANGAGVDLSHFGEKVGLAVQALLQIDEASRVSQAALGSAFNTVEKTEGAAAAFRLFGSAVLAAGSAAEDLGKKLTPIQQKNLDLARSFDAMNNGTNATVASVINCATAYQALIPTQAKLDDETDQLSKTFEDLQKNQLSAAQIAGIIGPRVDALAKGFEATGASAQDANPKMMALFDVVKSGRQDLEDAAVSLKALQDGFKAQITNSFSQAQPGPGGMIDFSRISSDIAQGGADFIAYLHGQLVGPISDDYRKLVEAAIKDTQNTLNAAYVEAQTKAAAQAAEMLKAAAAELGGVLGGIFSDLTMTGGKNIGQIGAQEFLKGVQKGSDILSTLFANAVSSAFGGQLKPGAIDQTTGLEMSPDQIQQQNKQADQNAAQVVGAISGAFGGITHAIDIMNNAKKGQETSVIGSVLSFTALGASIGTIVPVIGTLIGAIVGAVAGLVIAIVANTKARKEQPYALYGIEGGQPYVKPMPGMESNFANVTLSTQNDMIKRMWDALEGTTSEYLKLLIKLPMSIRDGMNLGIATVRDSTPTMDTWINVSRGFWHNFIKYATGLVPGLIAEYTTGGIGAGRSGLGIGLGTVGQQTGSGQIGNPLYDKTARTNWMSDFDNWVNNTLPKQIADKFRGDVAQGFVAMGMTLDHFNHVWDRLQGMDPKDAIAILNNIEDALIAFNDIKTSVMNFGQNGFDLSGGKLLSTGLQQGAGVSDFAQTLIDITEPLGQLKDAVYNLPFADQAAAAKQLGDSLIQVRGKWVDFMNSLIQMSQNLSSSINESRFGLKMDALKGNPQGQSDLLTSRLIQDRLNIQRAVNPAEVEKWTQDAQSVIQKLYELDPEKRREWADAQFAALDKLQQDNLKRLGDAATSVYQTMLATLQPVVEWFQGLPDSAGNSIDSLAQSADDAATALDNLTNSAGGHAGGHGGGRGDDGTDLGGDNGGTGDTNPTTGGNTTPTPTYTSWDLTQTGGRTPYSGGRPAGSSRSDVDAEILDHLDRQTRAAERVAAAVEAGEHIDLGELTINMPQNDPTGGGGRPGGGSQFVRDVATRRVIRGVS